jgi:hypothetical protein
VSNFVMGDSWLPQTGVPYTGGLIWATVLLKLMCSLINLCHWLKEASQAFQTFPSCNNVWKSINLPLMKMYDYFVNSESKILGDFQYLAIPACYNQKENELFFFICLV